MPYNPELDGAEMQFDGRMSYVDYLKIDALLDLQQPKTDAHDEMLFIIQHQTSELWMRLALHELEAARAHMMAGNVEQGFKMLARVSRIFEQLNTAWDVLRTMTPSDYGTFREKLGQSSGFQSYQYRMIEFILGNRNANMLRPHEHRPEILALLEDELSKPSIYDVAINALADAGFDLGDVSRRKTRDPYIASDAVRAAWLEIYLHPTKHWRLYELAEKLVDFEDYFRRWRFNHVTTVERVIGFKRGTGGTSGVNYLRRMLDVVLFPELWELRKEL